MALRIIKDPYTKAKWLVTEKGIKSGTKQYYLGTISWNDIKFITNKSTISKRAITQSFINMVTTKDMTPKYDRDIIEKLTLTEYLQISQALKFINLNYNKKNNSLTSIRLTNNSLK